MSLMRERRRRTRSGIYDRAGEDEVEEREFDLPVPGEEAGVGLVADHVVEEAACQYGVETEG